MSVSFAVVSATLFFLPGFAILVLSRDPVLLRIRHGADGAPMIVLAVAAGSAAVHFALVALLMFLLKFTSLPNPMVLLTADPAIERTLSHVLVGLTYVLVSTIVGVLLGGAIQKLSKEERKLLSDPDERSLEGLVYKGAKDDLPYELYAAITLKEDAASPTLGDMVVGKVDVIDMQGVQVSSIRIRKPAFGELNDPPADLAIVDGSSVSVLTLSLISGPSRPDGDNPVKKEQDLEQSKTIARRRLFGSVQP